ncbi:MAG: isopenicillin N synthase family oxygenase [Bdellovibrionaceae bacterium]|nr:isopenicillin N synthase family oxygenase [Pseudobdellovibrionaceae bacterium]
METVNIEKSSDTLRKVPTLSLRDYTQGSDSQRLAFIKGLYSGIVDYGFIILKDHGVDTKLFDRAYKMMAEYFAQPESVKLSHVSKAGAGQRGYTPFGQEHAKDSPVMDLKEFWHVGRELPPDHPLMNGPNAYPPNIWPSPEFKELFLQIYTQLERAGLVMLEALTYPLEVEKDFFFKMCENGNSILRLLHYPPIPEGVDPRCLRSAPHEDINLITILPAATAAGLQLKDRDGRWLDGIANEGELIVDAGDMLARLTNNVIPATTHQVINTPEATYSSRYSMPFFMHPRSEASLACLPSCRGKGAKFPDITAGEFLNQRLREIGLLK